MAVWTEIWYMTKSIFQKIANYLTCRKRKQKTLQAKSLVSCNKLLIFMLNVYFQGTELPGRATCSSHNKQKHLPSLHINQQTSSGNPNLHLPRPKITQAQACYKVGSPMQPACVEYGMRHSLVYFCTGCLPDPLILFSSLDNTPQANQARKILLPMLAENLLSQHCQVKTCQEHSGHCEQTKVSLPLSYCFRTVFCKNHALKVPKEQYNVSKRVQAREKITCKTQVKKIFAFS